MVPCRLWSPCDCGLVAFRPARDPRLVNSPQSLPAPPMAAQAGLKADSPLDRAVSETKRYAARIVGDPGACPMFPHVNEHNGAAETFCYVQGYLAGLVASSGQRPTKAEMDELVHETLNDPNVCDMAVKMQADVKFLDTRYPPREY